MFAKLPFSIFLVSCFFLLLSAGLCAHEESSRQMGDRSIEQSRMPKKNHLGLDMGVLTSQSYYMFAISYCRRVSKNSLRGGGIGFSWEDNFNSFNKNLYDVLWVEVFQRYQPRVFYHVDFGATAFASTPMEGGSGAWFAGGYMGAVIGWRLIFVGCNFRVGVATDDDSSDFGIVWRPHMRFIIAF